MCFQGRLRQNFEGTRATAIGVIFTNDGVRHDVSFTFDKRRVEAFWMDGLVVHDPHVGAQILSWLAPAWPNNGWTQDPTFDDWIFQHDVTLGCMGSP